MNAPLHLTRSEQLVSEWHTSDSPLPLNDYLGLSECQYGEFLRHPSRFDVHFDLAPHSDAYCLARGIRPAREDWAANELVELPAVEFRGNVLAAVSK